MFGNLGYTVKTKFGRLKPHLGPFSSQILNLLANNFFLNTIEIKSFRLTVEMEFIMDINRFLGSTYVGLKEWSVGKWVLYYSQ